MTEHIEEVSLLVQGSLPPTLFNDKKYAKLLPIVNAINHLASKGEHAPYDTDRVFAVADKKFHASDYHEQLLEEVKQLKPDKVILEAVQHRFILEKAIEVVSNQLSQGQWNPAQVEALFNTASPADEGYIRPISKPISSMVRFITRTGFREVDALIGGLGAELWIVSARAKTGKSTFMLNLVARQPKDVKALYITAADYGYDEINFLLNQIKPDILKLKEDSLFIADMTFFSASVLDVENALRKHRPQLCIIDRAEKLRPLIRYTEHKRTEIADIFDTIRRLAKKYNCAIITDAQYSSAGADMLRGKNRFMSAEFMAEDRTNRAAVMDGFIGLERVDGGVRLWLEGRRPGTLPANVELKTDNLGRYL